MILDIEHFHCTVNYKQGFRTMFQYALLVRAILKKGLRSFTQWSTFYYTSKDSWYPLPENSINFKNVKVSAPLPLQV